MDETIAPLRVVIFSTGLSTGGAEMMLLKLAGSLMPSGFEFRVVSLRDEGTIGPRLRALGVPVDAMYLHQPWRAVWCLPRALARIRRFRPDLLLGWMYHGNLAARLARAVTGRIPLVWSIRQTLYDIQGERALTAGVIRLGARWSVHPGRIIYNSSLAASQHRAQGYSPQRDVVVANGFDLTRFQPDSGAHARLCARLGIPEVPLIGLVARYHPMKDHRTFLRAAAAIAEVESAAHFVCAGPRIDDANADLAAMIAQSGLKDRVHLLGEVSATGELLAGLDLLCSSSSSGEGFSNVIGEAMACGVPCVVTDVGDSALIVGATGRVVPPGEPGRMAGACLELLRLPEAARHEMSRAARERIQTHFSLPAIAREYAVLLRNAVFGRSLPLEPEK